MQATSIQAFEAIKPELTELQAKVLQYAKDHPEGFTDEQLNRYFDTHRSTYRTRRAELTEQKLIVDTGRRERMDSGKNAIVWAIPQRCAGCTLDTCTPGCMKEEEHRVA